MNTGKCNVVDVACTNVGERGFVITLMLDRDRPSDYSGVIIDGKRYEPVWDTIPGFSHVSFIEKEPIDPQSNEIEFV